MTVEFIIPKKRIGLEFTIPAADSGADKHFVHNQMSPSNTWTVAHGLNKYPSVHVIDSAGQECIGTITYDTLNQLTITFNAAFSGKAYLN
ncbi:MAG: hypothetical protein H6606_06090 [Flavobacteriales bacterium]|nr:hypothetical protein [Flavobacteriales bacterium]